MSLRQYIQLAEQLLPIARLDEDLDDDISHGEALARTGFWGAQGAGLVFFAEDTKRFLIAHRSDGVEQPGTWGTWGGAIDRGDSPAAAASREAHEECGYNGPMRLIPLYVFKKKTFRYSNFLGVIDHEFEPQLNWESQGYQWCEYGHWPSPLHFGLAALLNDPTSARRMQALAGI